jgi:hypothetical protein
MSGKIKVLKNRVNLYMKISRKIKYEKYHVKLNIKNIS